MASLPDLWPAQAVYRLFPSDPETRSLPSWELPGLQPGHAWVCVSVGNQM